MTDASKRRIERFVEWFIRLDGIEPDIQELYLSDPERADRMNAAAEDGASGSTHQEVIDDWRKAFSHWVRYSRKGFHQQPERFIAAVEAHFDVVEQWHINNGSIDEELG